MIPVTDIRARESFCFMRWSKSSWGFFRWVSCSLFFISYQPFHSPCSCISRSPGSAERACGASPWQRWPPCWCPALPLGQDAALQQQLAGQVASEEENGVQHTFNIKVGKYSEICEAEGIVWRLSPSWGGYWEGGGGDNEILGGLFGRNSVAQYRTQVNNHPSCDWCLRTVHSTLISGIWA